MVISKGQLRAIIVALGGAALMAFCAYAFSAPLDLSNATAVSLLNLRTCGFLLGLSAAVGGTIFGLCAR